MTEVGSGKGFLSKIVRGLKRKEKAEKNDPSNEISIPPQITHHPTGLKELIEGTNPTVDIVAIHGLNGHREKTWEAENEVNWLKDEEMLHKRLPNARIFVWGYDANTHSKDEYLSEVYLHQHGFDLLSQLSTKRQLDGTEKRPIIFIGHSLGGIVIKSALIYSNAANETHLPEHRAVKVSTYGILFMGTPHSGGEGVALGRVAAQIASVFIHTNEKVLKHLEKQSEWLSKQKTDYGPISDRFVTKFGYEGKKTPLFGGISSKIIVPSWSAIGWEHNAEPVLINANHITMVKFTGDEDEDYRKVWEKLVIMERAAHEKVKANWAVEEKEPPVVIYRYVLVNEPYSLQEKLEFTERLRYPASDINVNNPDDKVHFTQSRPDVVFDRKANIYKARPLQTLVGESLIMEETESMRDHQKALINAAERYESKVGVADATLSTKLVITAQHNWNDVLNEVETLSSKEHEFGGLWNTISLTDGLRKFAITRLKIEDWLALLPGNTLCASRLCGGLRMVLSIIWRSKLMSSDIYEALEQIPSTISDAQSLTPQYDQETLADHVEQLYCAILDVSRHIIRTYSRVVVQGHRVHFSLEESNGIDLELLRRYQRLIDLKQKLVKDQHVRLEALNYLCSMGEKEWDAILGVLEEQLIESYDEKRYKLEYGVENNHSYETSENAELYKALEYDYFLCQKHLEEILECLFRVSVIEKARVRYLVDNEELRRWMSSPSSDLFLINGNEASHDRASPVSLFCGMLTRALQSQKPRIVLYWFCGLNTDANIAEMLGNLIGQLLDQIEAKKSPLKAIDKIWYRDFVVYDQMVVFDLFKKILIHQLKSAVVFCIVDGVSFYEDHERSQGFEDLVEDLAALVSEAQESKRIFKVLFTSPIRSQSTKAVARESLQELDIPPFIDTGRSDFATSDFISSLNRRRSSINTVSSLSVYEDAFESFDDLEEQRHWKHKK